MQISPEDIDKFIRESEKDYYFPIDRVKDAVRRNRMFNVLDQKTIIKIDCVIKKNDEFHLNAFSRRENVNYSGDFNVWIINKEDLILSKLNWAKNTRSEMQMRDVASILRNGYDEKYVREWAQKLEIESLLEECIELVDSNYVEGYDS